jgi:hypothetical protein
MPEVPSGQYKVLITSPDAVDEFCVQETEAGLVLELDVPILDAGSPHRHPHFITQHAPD